MLAWGQAVPRRVKLPSRYQVLITRTGRPPLAFSLAPFWVVFALALFVLWGASMVYFYRTAQEAAALKGEVEVLSRQVRELSGALLEKDRKNRELAAEAVRMLEQLERFEAELRALRERAGLKQKEEKKALGEPLGAGRPADTEELFAALKARVAAMQKELKGEIAPALERTLRREAAIPRGLPLRAKTYLASGFGVRRSPFGGGYEFHDGVDLPAPYGTPIYATAPGRVVEAGWSPIFGRYVKLDHGFGYQTLYGHMSRIEVDAGQWVERGQEIGRVGSTGRSTGPHLHYSVFVQGRATDPRPYLDSRAFAGR